MSSTIELTEMLKTTDRFGNLMPAFVKTPYSDAGINELLCERVCDDNTGNIPWIRLTEKGQMAVENVRSGGACFATAVER